jgi:hypothetical protein
MRWIIPTPEELRNVLVTQATLAQQAYERATTIKEKKYEAGKQDGLREAIYYLDEYVKTLAEAAAAQ